MKFSKFFKSKQTLPMVYFIAITSLVCAKFKLLENKGEQVPPKSCWYKPSKNQTDNQIEYSPITKYNIK